MQHANKIKTWCLKQPPRCVYNLQPLKDHYSFFPVTQQLRGIQQCSHCLLELLWGAMLTPSMLLWRCCYTSLTVIESNHGGGADMSWTVTLWKVWRLAQWRPVSSDTKGVLRAWHPPVYQHKRPNPVNSYAPDQHVKEAESDLLKKKESHFNY